MVRITPQLPPTPVRRAGSRGQRSFASELPAAEAPSGSRPAQPTTSVDMLLVLAAGDDEAERRRKAAAHADAGLAALEALEEEAEGGDSERLEALAAWVGEVPEPQDPQLEALLEAIRLRAQVELAKRGR